LRRVERDKGGGDRSLSTLRKPPARVNLARCSSIRPIRGQIGSTVVAAYTRSCGARVAGSYALLRRSQRHV
jgi:hypothetical protein